MITIIKPVKLFTTPKDMDEWIANINMHPMEDRGALFTAGYTMCNLAAQETDKLRENSNSYKRLMILLDDVKGFMEADTNVDYAIDLTLADANNQGQIYQLVKDLLTEAMRDKL